MNPQAALQQRARVQAFQRKHRVSLLTLLFTDIVASTRLKQQLGDQEAVRLIHEHHAAVRELLSRFVEGEEINAAGDSFFIVFAKPSDAVRFSLLLQASFRAPSEGPEPRVRDRIGIHVGEVMVEERTDSPRTKDLYGIQVDTCSRVASLAEADQILLSRGAFDSARQVLKGEDIPGVTSLSWLNHGPYVLKGVDEPLEICEVGETQQARLRPPPNSEKVHRHISPDMEPVLGWRPAIGQTVPNTKWMLEKQLGEGGFGEVWLGRHETLKQQRVFKFCFRADRVRPLKREVTLFRLMKERIGDHPNIVAVLDVFFDEPPYYLMMDHAEGQDLGVWGAARGGADKIPLPIRLEIVAQLADALQAAHDAGVIHRDVKPSNILICGMHSEKEHILVKLTDFGIGQVMSPDTLEGMTRLGFTQTMFSTGTTSHSGTQMYMAPELLAGKPASTRSDIYSLGVVLYQLLAGDFSKPLTTDWAEQISDPLLRDDLKHCFAGKPLDRFAGAAQLAKHLRSLPQRQAALALQQTEAAQREKAAYRRGMLRATAIATVVVGLVVVLALIAARQARLAREASAQAYLDQARAGRFGGRSGQRFDGLAALAKAAMVRPTIDLRSEAIACMALADLRLAKQWDASPPGARSVAFDHNLARYASGDEQGKISVRQIENDQELFSLPGIGMPVEQMLFSPNGQLLALNYRGKDLDQLQVVDLNRRADILNLPEGVHEKALDFSPDSKRLAVGRKDGSIHIYELSSGRESKVFSSGPPPNALRFHPQGRRLAVSSRESFMVRILDVDGGEPIKALTHRGQVNDLAWHPDGFYLATACVDLDIYFWDTEKGEHYALLKGSEGEPLQVAFNHGGDLLASTGADGNIRFWQPFTGRQLTRAPGVGVLGGLQFSGDDRHLGGTLSAIQLSLWEVADGRECRTLHGHVGAGKVNQLATSSSGRLLASSSSDGVQLWDLALGKKLDFLKIGATASVHFEQGDKGLIASDLFGLHYFPIKPDTNSAAGLLRIGPAEKLLSPPVELSATTSDGGFLTVIHQDHIDLLNKQKPSLNKKFTNHPGVKIVSISPDGRWIAGSSSARKSIKIWDVRSGEDARTLDVKTQAHLLFSPDAHWLVTGTGEEFRFWKVGSWEAGLRIPRVGAGDQPGAMAFSPDGRMLAIAHSLTLTQLIEPATGQLLATLEAPDAKRLSWLCFSPDGSQLAAATENQLIHVWCLPLIRRQLATLKLDWDHPPETFNYLREPPSPLRLAVELGDLAISHSTVGQPSKQTPEEELEVYNTTLAANPNDAEAYHQRGHVHESMGRWQMAFDDFSHSLTLKPGQAALYRDRAGVLESLKQTEQAIADATRAIEIDPKESPNYHFRARLHFGHLDYQKAIADLSKAIELNPVSLVYWVWRANCYAETGQWEKARGDFQRSIEMDAHAVPPRLGLVLASLAQGDTEAYRQACESLNQGFLNSENHVTAVDSAKLCALLPNAVSNFTAVVHAAVEVIDKHRNDSELIVPACLVLYRAGRFDVAVRRLNELPPPPSANQRSATRWDGYRGLILAMSFQRLGQTQEARLWIDKANRTLGQSADGRTAGLAALSWEDRVALQALRREAEQLVHQGASQINAKK